MRRARRFPQRLVRWTSLCACLALILTSLALVPFSVVTGNGSARYGTGRYGTGRHGTARSSERVGPAQGQSNENGKARKVNAKPPQPGPPAAKLPNLDDVRRSADEARRNGRGQVHAPQPIPSTRRGRRGGRASSRMPQAQTSNLLLADASPPSRRRELKADVWSSLSPRASRDPISDSPIGLFSSLRTNVAPEPQGYYNLPMARLDPHNRTGTGGEDLLSNNFNWNLPLLGLAGRGLDLGLTLSYNSLVWTRSGNYIDFDTDEGSMAPGFRLGFPTVEGPYWNDQAGTYFYLMVLPSGGRAELRRIGSSNTYESADSAHLQLIDNGTSLLVRPTDGTQLSFVSVNYAWRCNQIKDRNGNYLTVSYNSSSDISTITDTLGRVVTFNYDGYANLLSITQTWNGQTHQWATFGYGSVYIGYNFPGLTSYGPDDSYITVLTQVGLPDGSRYNFEYNNPYGQVSTIRYYAADNHQRRYTTYVYSANGSDCPRISERRDWAENWNGINGVPAEVATQFSEPGDGSHQMVAPDGTVFKEFYGTGWQKGLTTQSEVWSGGVRQKWTTAAWTQDNTGVSYQTNPRVTETNVYDSNGNRRRTTVGYQTFSLPSGASCSLPNDISEFAADAATVLRRTQTYFETSATYLDRRIIGLPWLQTVTDGGGNLVSKQDFHYDWGGDYMAAQGQPVQHDGTNYGAGFLAGRGNLVLTRQFDVNYPNDNSRTHDAGIRYNTAGSVTFKGDASWHGPTVSYTDSFSDSVNRNTFAYPTTVTDADGFSSYLQYNYDFGAKTRAQGPPPAGQSQGAIQTIAYDTAARVDRVTTTNTGAYTRYVYGPDYVQSFGSVNNLADDSYSIGYFDGAGRVFATAGYHPGSTGGYKAQLTYYDVMGRTMKQSNPIEIYGSWAPAGDDAAGWIFTQQTYDWKGRPLVTTNTDGTQKYASYSACGCAGSEVATLTDELGRQQKVYKDVLGRVTKTEALNWDSSVYATTANFYNARDQVTLLRQYQGTDTSGVYQETAMSYDGYGRLLTKHVPEQDAGTATVYSYNSDDTVNSVTDARGASATYGYNNRHLVTGINYSAPSGVTATPNATYGYDALGNRTSMSDGLGSKSYAYNQLSQLTSEERTFNGVGTFTLSYDYNLAGELTKITDPTNMSINYGYDSVGRLTGVTGSDSLYANVSNYASNFQYRAWGGLKAMTDGKGYVSSLLYNSKLQPSHFEISSNTVSQDYDYYNDGRISVVHNTPDQNFDRSYTYDHVGRLTEAKSGGDVNGYQYAPIPYYETFGYDGFSNLTARQSQSWNGLTDDSDAATYTNNRRDGWGYDADGRNTTIDTRTNTFDAVGQQSVMTAQQVLWNGNHITVNQARSYDGDAAMSKEVVTRSGYANTTYYLRSSVLGGAIIEGIDSSGQKNAGYVYSPGGQLLATQTPNYPTNMVTWKHNTPAGTGEYTVNTYNGVPGRTEFDPLGANLSLTAPEEPPPSEGNGDIGAGHFGGLMDARWSDFFNLSSGCTKKGVAASCHEIVDWVNVTGTFGGRREFGPLGFSMPNWAWDQLWKKGWQKFIRVISGKEGFEATLPQNSVVGPEDLKAYKARIDQMLKDEKCASFLKQLLNEAKTLTGRSYNGVLGTFDSIKFSWVAEKPWHGGHASFENGSPIATIDNTVKTEKFISADRTGYLISSTTQSFLGETLHHVGVGGMYGDGVMAQALNNILVSQGKDQLRTFDRRGVDPGGVETASKYWHPKVENYCHAPRQ